MGWVLKGYFIWLEKGPRCFYNIFSIYQNHVISRHSNYAFNTWKYFYNSTESRWKVSLPQKIYLEIINIAYLLAVFLFNTCHHRTQHGFGHWALLLGHLVLIFKGRIQKHLAHHNYLQNIVVISQEPQLRQGGRLCFIPHQDRMFLLKISSETVNHRWVIQVLSSNKIETLYQVMNTCDLFSQSAAVWK